MFVDIHDDITSKLSAEYKIYVSAGLTLCESFEEMRATFVLFSLHIIEQLKKIKNSDFFFVNLKIFLKNNLKIPT